MISQIPQNAFDWYTWVILPLIIFISRIFDMSLGTIRIISVSRGLRKIAPILGFFEVLIWVLVIGQVEFKTLRHQLHI